MSGLLRSATFVVLSAAVIAVIWAGFVVWDRMEEGRRFRDRVKWLPAALVLLLLGFGLIVEWRCLVGWINPEECHLWDR